MDNSKTLSRQEGFLLEFNYLMPKTGKPFELRITQEELVEHRISVDIRQTYKDKVYFLDNVYYSDFRARLLHQNSHNIRKYLTSLINIFGTSEKVRIYPVLDTGDPDIGYRLLTSDDELRILPENENYIDVDLNKENDIYKLQHIINLLYTGRFAFIVKRPSSNFDNEMIFAFNRDGFLEPNEIFSSVFEIKQYSTKFRGDNNHWRSLWVCPQGWTTNPREWDNDINSYIRYLEETIDNVNEFIRRYMGQMEFLYPGFTTYIKNYLNL